MLTAPVRFVDLDLPPARRTALERFVRAINERARASSDHHVTITSDEMAALACLPHQIVEVLFESLGGSASAIVVANPKTRCESGKANSISQNESRNEKHNARN